LYGFSKWNVGEEAGNVKGTEENRGGREGQVQQAAKSSYSFFSLAIKTFPQI